MSELPDYYPDWYREVRAPADAEFEHVAELRAELLEIPPWRIRARRRKEQEIDAAWSVAFFYDCIVSSTVIARTKDGVTT